jgi:DNA processing protein
MAADEAAFPPPQDQLGRFHWLRLARSQGVGPMAFRRLATRFASPLAALGALPDLVSQRGARAYVPADAAAVEAEFEAAARAGARLICLGDEDYPALLAAIPDPPPALWALGDSSLAHQPCVALAGARNASANGRRLAALIAEGVGAAGFSVVSGLARGVDAAAHEASLATGAVAVSAGGVDVVYPPENAGLAARIAEHGLILSEAPMGEQPVARSFPRRNRIVSGLSLGVVLVEAAERSGSLITARVALEQGREVMAAPGSPLDPRAAGCNALIREGATLIRSAADVVEALAAPTAPRTRAEAARRAPTVAPAAATAPAHATAPGDDPELVVSLIGPEPVAFDALAVASGLGAARLAAALAELEVTGRIDRRPGDMVALL